MVMVFVMAVLAVDVGRIYLARSELQSAADAAAMAAAARLPDGPEAALAAASEAALRNPVLGSPLVLADGDVSFGTWDEEANVFIPLAPSDWGSADAVRVSARRESSRGTGVRLQFGAIVGLSDRDASAQAIAAAGTTRKAIVGIEWVKISGNAGIDSYDSGLGTYSSTRRDSAVVMSNGPITMSGATRIDGEAKAGPGHSVTGGSVKKGRSSLPMPMSYKAPSPEDFGAAGATALGNVHLSGKQSLVLSEGTYVAGDLTMSGQATLDVTGKVTLFITGSVSMSGRITTLAKRPENLQIRVVGSGPVQMSGTADFYGEIYAPDAPIRFSGTSGFFGAFVGRTLEVSGTADLHQDESLASRSGARLVR